MGTKNPQLETQVSQKDAPQNAPALPTSQEGDLANTLMPEAASQRLAYKRIYDDDDLSTEEITIGRLIIQREPSSSSVSRISASMRKLGQIQPVLLVQASDCITQKLGVLVDGKVLTEEDPNLHNTYVILDGGTRVKAAQKCNSSLKKKESPIKLHYIVVEVKDRKIYNLLQTTNSEVVKWSKATHTESLVAAKKGEQVCSQKLDWICEKIKLGVCSEAAAYLWSDLKEKSVPSKAAVAKAYGNQDAYAKITDDSRFAEGKELFDAWSTKFNSALVGLKAIPGFITKAIDDMVNVKKSTLTEAKDHLLGFIRSISKDDVEALKAVKGNFVEKSSTLNAMLRTMYDNFQTQPAHEESNAMDDSTVA